MMRVVAMPRKSGPAIHTAISSKSKKVFRTKMCIRKNVFKVVFTLLLATMVHIRI